MATKPPNGWRSGPHRPGYKHPNRENKRVIAIWLTEDQFDSVTKRAAKDGTTKQEVGTTLFDNYAKRGLTPG